MPVKHSSGRLSLSISKQRALDYVERFHHLSEDEQIKRVNAIGYESFRDVPAHILAWWDARPRPDMIIQSGDSP
jgi:hypothetical protein